MSSLMMALVRRNMEHLTGHHNKVVILMHLLVFYKDIIQATFHLPKAYIYDRVQLQLVPIFYASVSQVASE
jgi:hypothetical protein